MEMEGIASIALLPSGSISGHFIRQPDATCFALYGTQIACQRECSRGEDYRLITLTIFDYSSKRGKDVVVECRGQDAARFQNADHVHGWEEDVISMVEKNKAKQNKLFVSFECETLKAEKDAEDHINRFLPHLIGHDAVVNIGTMKIRGLNFDLDDDQANVLEDKELGRGCSVTGTITSCQSEYEYKFELPDHSVESNSGNDYDLSSLLGLSKQESSDPEEDVIRQMLAEELKAEGITENIPENKWKDSSSGWKIKKQVVQLSEE